MTRKRSAPKLSLRKRAVRQISDDEAAAIVGGGNPQTKGVPPGFQDTVLCFTNNTIKLTHSDNHNQRLRRRPR